MMTADPADLEQLLADTWNHDLASRIADQVARPGGRGYIVRAVAIDDAPEDLVLYVDELIADALARETGVDVDWAHRDTSWSALDDVYALLRDRWADGGTLPTVGAQHHHEAHKLLTQDLTPKAAEQAGCDVDLDPAAPPSPLVIGGRLRVDRDGLQAYLDHFGQYGVTPAEHTAIARLHDLANSTH